MIHDQPASQSIESDFISAISNSYVHKGLFPMISENMEKEQK